MIHDFRSLGDAGTCPASGLAIQRKAEWTDIDCGEGFSVSFAVIGGRILVSRSEGWKRARNDAIEQMFQHRKRVIDAVIGSEAPFVELRDYSGFSGRTHRSARDRFIKGMDKDRNRIIGFIGYCTPFAVRVALKVGATIHKAPFPLLVSRDYESAVTNAVELLRVRGLEPSIAAVGSAPDIVDEVSRSRPGSESYPQENLDLQDFIDELLHHIGAINWDVEGSNATESARSSSHPFAMVFEAIDLVKMDLNEQLKRRIRAEAEQRKLERRLQQVQRVEAIGTFAGGIAHDFKNLLSPIMLHTELALDGIDSSSKAGENLQQVLGATLKARALAKRILTMSRPVTNEAMEPVLLQDVAREVLDLLRPSAPRTVEIHEEIDVTCSEISGDATELFQTLMNLCTNALQALTESGGALSLSLEEREVRGDELQSLAPGRYAVLTVRDTGRGIPTEAVERIYDPYFSTKPEGEGTGLGLSVVHAAVVRHGGEIRVQSTEGGGTTFTVYFPALSGLAPTLDAAVGD